MDDAEMEDSDGEKLAAEIYDIIGMTVMGEALMIVKGVQDMNGVELTGGCSEYIILIRRHGHSSGSWRF